MSLGEICPKGRKPLNVHQCQYLSNTKNKHSLQILSLLYGWHVLFAPHSSSQFVTQKAIQFFIPVILVFVSIIAMPSNQLAMASTLLATASKTLAMASNLRH